MTTVPTFDEIAGSLGRANHLALDPAGQRHALTLLRTLAEGEPVPIARLAALTGRSREETEGFLDSLPGVYRDDDGAVIGFWGLAVTHFPPHRYRLNGADLYTWCAWDPFILTDWLGGTAEVASVDARTADPVEFRIEGGGVVGLSHPELTLSFRLSEEWTADVIANFCHFIHYFTDEASAAAWTDEHPGTFVLSLEDAIALGRVWGEQVFPDLDPGVSSG